MSDERFDNQIKKKLESYRPTFEESAWRKFRAAMPVPWYISLFRDWGGWIFGGVASMAFLTTLYLNYLQSKTNELLNEEISTIKTFQNPAISTDTIVVERYLTDTVYIVKTIRQVVEVPTRSSNSSRLLTRDTPIQSDAFDDYQKEIKTNENIVGVDSFTENETTTTNVKESSNKPGGYSITTRQQKDSLVNKNKEEINGSENSFREKPELVKEKIEVENKPPISDLAVPEAKPTTAAKKKINFPYIRTRVGIDSDYLGLIVPSVGPAAEFFLGYSKLSLSTGLLFSSPQEIRHKLTKDYNQATGKRFEDIYKDKVQVPPQRRIEDITIRTSFIKLPIAFNYYINTKSNFSFIITTGTRLDISVFQDVQFESSLLTDKIKQKFESKPKPQVFSGLFYGTGLQYQKGRFVGQFTPYFDFKFRQNDYLVIPRTFGLNAAIKYDLGRGL